MTHRVIGKGRVDMLFGSLRQTRDGLVRRGVKVASATRDRGVEALQKVRDGAIDWRQTLDARRAELEPRQGWFGFVALQARVLDELDRALGGFSERVRAEAKRLQRLELPVTSEPTVEAPPKRESSSRADRAEPASVQAPVTRESDGEAKAERQGAAKRTSAKRKTAQRKTAQRKTAERPSEKRASAKAKPSAKTTKRAGSNRLVFPIADYDAMGAKAVLAELPRLSDAQCKIVLEHERAHKKRKTVLQALARRAA